MRMSQLIRQPQCLVKAWDWERDSYLRWTYGLNTFNINDFNYRFRQGSEAKMAIVCDYRPG